MTTTTANPIKEWTVEELLAMPDDGIERWIINGQLRENHPEFPGVKMLVRNRHHSEIMALITGAILFWLKRQPRPRGKVYCGEVGVKLSGRLTAVGVDVVFATEDIVASQDDSTTLLSGAPSLVVEILSPNDMQQLIDEKIDTYLAAGVPIIWIVDPHRRTVTLHGVGRLPELFNSSQTLPEHPRMPGFAPTVIELFE